MIFIPYYRFQHYGNLLLIPQLANILDTWLMGEKFLDIVKSMVSNSHLVIISIVLVSLTMMGWVKLKMITLTLVVNPIVIWMNATCMNWMVKWFTLHQLIGLLFHRVWKEPVLPSRDSLQVKGLKNIFFMFSPNVFYV